MPDIDLSFLTKSNDQLTATADELKLITDALDALGTKQPELVALANAFGVTYTQVDLLTKSLGITSTQTIAAVTAMEALKTSGASASEQFTGLVKNLKLSEEQLRGLSAGVSDLATKTPGINALSEAFAGLFLIQKAEAFKAAVLDSIKVFENLNAQLKTVLGTQAAADAAFIGIQKFAATTPFALTEVTQSFIQLKQRGVQPTTEALKSFGDIATSQGRSLDQLTQAVLGATQDRFERLREFGITASSAGDKVNFSFQGVNKTFQKTPEGITKGIIELGKLQGVAGGMAQKADTLSGALINLGDNQDRLTNDVGKFVVGPATALIKAANSVVDTFYEMNPAMQATILAVGSLGTAFVLAVGAITAFKAAGIAASLSQAKEAIALTVTQGSTAALTATKIAANIVQVLYTKAIGGTTVALEAETVAAGEAAAATLLAVGPFVAVAAAVAVLVGSYANLTEEQGQAAADGRTLEANLSAITAGTLRRKEASEAAAKSETDENTAKIESLKTQEQRLQELADQDLEFRAQFKKSAEERINGFTKVLEFLINPGARFVALTDGSASIVEKIFGSDSTIGQAAKKLDDKVKASLPSIAQTLKEGDLSAAFKETTADTEKLRSKLEELRKTPGGLGKVSIQEADALSKAYASQIDAVSKIVPKDAEQAKQKAKLIETLKSEQEEVNGVNKLLLEQQQRLGIVGPAVQQYAAEVKQALERIGKGIADESIAKKVVDTTKKQFEAGFIDEATANKQLAAVKNYQSVSAAVQEEAGAEILNNTKQRYKEEQNLLEVSIKAKQALATQEIQTQGETGVQVAELQQQVTDSKIEGAKETLNIEESSGRKNSKAYKEAAHELLLLTIEADNNRFNVQLSKAKEADERLALQTRKSAQVIAAATTKSATAGQQATLDALKTGNKDLAQAEGEATAASKQQQKANLADQIDLKRKQVDELSKATTKDGKLKAVDAANELLKLQSEQAQNEIDIIKTTEANKTGEIERAQAKRKALTERASGGKSAAVAKEELAAVQAGFASRASLDAAAATKRIAIERNDLAQSRQLLLEKVKQIQEGVAAGTISREKGAKDIIQLQTDLAKSEEDIAKKSLEAVTQVEQAKLAVIRENLQRQQALIDNRAAKSNQSDSAKALADYKAGNKNIATADAELAVKQFDTTHRQTADKAKALEKQLADIKVAVKAGTLTRDEGRQQELAAETQLQQALDELHKGDLAGVQEQIDLRNKLIEAEAKSENDRILSLQAQSDASLAKLSLANSRNLGQAKAEIERRQQEATASFAEQTSRLALESAKRREDAIGKLIGSGKLVGKEAEEQKLNAATGRFKAEAKLIQQQSDLEQLRIKQTSDRRQEAFEIELRKRQLILEQVKGAGQKEVELLKQQKELVSARDKLESARSNAISVALSGRRQELELQQKIADKEGDKEKSERLGLQIKQLDVDASRAQRDEIERQFSIKEAELAIDIRSKQIAADQLLLEKEYTVLQDKQALAQAILTGKSKEEVALLAQKLGFSEQGVELAKGNKENVGTLGDLQKQSLGLEKGSALSKNAQDQQSKQTDLNIAQGNNSVAQIDNSTKGITAAGTGDILSTIGSSAGAASTGLTTFSDNLTKSADSAKSFIDALTAASERLGLPNTQASNSSSAPPRKLAVGGSVVAGETAMVGEIGPELVTFGSAAHVWTASMTDRILGNQAGELVNNARAADGKQDNGSVVAELKSVRGLLKAALANAGRNVAEVHAVNNNDQAVELALQLLRTSRRQAFGG